MDGETKAEDHAMSDTIKTLTEAVRGRVITPSDSDYDEARAVYNVMHDRRPRAVIQCVDAADVMAVVRAARDAGLDLAIRGGGHSVPGFGTVDGGLVIDLPLRPGGARRDHLDHRGRRPDAGRRHRLPDPRRRALHR